MAHHAELNAQPVPKKQSLLLGQLHTEHEVIEYPLNQFVSAILAVSLSIFF